LLPLEDPIAEEEVAIDTVLKEITENLLPTKESRPSDEEVKPKPSKDEKMEVDKSDKEEKK
jgi:hypothetical protein